MTTLQVLCPNGRRQNVKTNPNTKLLQVLEEVCQKQKFLPSEDYKLIHGRTTLDLTLSVRFAGLINNAKLELVKCEKSREETEVVIALQLEGGERLQHSFSPGTSLWDVLLHWENIPDSPHKDKLTSVDALATPPVHPVCIYMREEVTGELALKETKLRTLGLTGGKAVLRLLHRSVDDKTVAEIADKIEKEKLRKAKLEQASTQNIKTNAGQTTAESLPKVNVNESNTTTAVIKSDSATISLNINVNIQNQSESKPSKTESADQAMDKGEEPAHKIGRMERSHDDSEPMEVEPSYSNEAVMETESIEEVTRVSDAASSNTNKDPATAQRQSQREAAESLRVLNIPGVEIFTPDDFSDLTPEEQQIARRLAEAYLPRMVMQASGGNDQGVPSQGAVPKKKKSNMQPIFSDFKFPEETKGQILYQNDLSEVNKEDFKPCDRQTVVYNLEETIRTADAPGDSELPDDFFEVTESDIKKLLAAQKKKMDEAMNQPLMTSTMRKARLEEEYGRYEKVVIRVQFQDKLVLQGLFRPRETVFALQKFVKEYLEDKSIPFYLYTTPPKCLIKDVSQTLIEARLVPATVIYFGCDQHREHYLSDAVMSEVGPRLKADQIVAECLNSPSSDGQCSSSQSSSSSSKGKQPVSRRSQESLAQSAWSSSTSSPSSSTPTTQGQEKSVPKWFKGGKK